MTISRRRMLQALTVGAGAATFAPVSQLWRLATVRAADSVPKRLLIFFHQNGFRDPKVDHVPVVHPTDFELGAMSSPLERHRKDLVVLHTLSQGGSSHNHGYNGLLTGKPVGNNPRDGKSISLDRYLARVVGREVTPALPNLHLGMVPKTEGASFDDNGTLVRPNPDPYDAYNQVFGDFGGDATLDTDSSQRASNRAKLRRSVLDAVRGDLSAFRARLGPEDRVRADAQLEAIRTLERRLETPVITEVEGLCASPALAKGIPVEGDSRGLSTPAKVRAQLDLVQAAFACDLTRIATFYLETQNADGVAAGFDPVNSSDTWHGLSHGKPGSEEYRAFVRAQNWAFSQVADLADRFKAIPEGDGNMLDNTLVLVISEIAVAHSNSGYIWYTLGGRNLGVNTGRLLDLNDAPHWNLHTSVMNLMGVAGNFGDATGPLEGFTV